MKSKKILKSVLSLLVMLSLVLTSISLTAFAADAAVIPLEGNYTFLNVAYSPDSDVYVAVAKDLTDTTNTPMKVLVSKNGYAWTETTSFSKAVNSYQAASRQLLTYWDTQKVFVIIAGSSLYSSADGLSWTAFEGGLSNGVIADNGNELIVGGTGKMRVFSALDNYAEVAYNNSGIYTGYMAVKGNAYFVSAIAPTSTAYAYSITKTTDSETGEAVYSVTTLYPKNINANTSVTYLPYSDNHIMAVNNSNYRGITTNPTGEKTVTFSDGTTNESTITATGYANGITYLGTIDGKVYYTEATSTPTNDTVWSVSENVSKATEEIKAFTQGKDGRVIVLGAKNVYILENGSYKNISEYSEINVPTVRGGNVFKGISLLGGEYAEGKGYIVYGNDADSKGKIYHSEDGINWSLVLSSNNKFGGNKSIYWENKGLFVIVMSKDWAGCCYYSFDGKSWYYSQSVPGATANGSIGLGAYGTVDVNGDYLYTNSGSSGKYVKTTVTVETDLETGKQKIAAFESTSVSVGFSKYFASIAVSDETTPSVFMSLGYGPAYVYDGATETEYQSDKIINSASGNSVIAKWDSNLKKFVGIRKDLSKAYIIDKSLTVTGMKVSASGKTISSFENNGTNYVFGTSDGSLVSVKSADIETATAFNDVTAVDEANTLPVNDVYKAGDKFIAVASDGTNSEILIVNAEATQYKKASDYADIVFADGSEAIVSVPVVNNSETAINGKMLIAVYENNRLVQIEIEDAVIPATFSGEIEQSIEFNSSVNGNCTMRVYIWDSVAGMKPLCEASPFFE